MFFFPQILPSRLPIMKHILQPTPLPLLLQNTHVNGSFSILRWNKIYLILIFLNYTKSSIGPGRLFIPRNHNHPQHSTLYGLNFTHFAWSYLINEAENIMMIVCCWDLFDFPGQSKCLKMKWKKNKFKWRKDTRLGHECLPFFLPRYSSLCMQRGETFIHLSVILVKMSIESGLSPSKSGSRPPTPHLPLVLWIVFRVYCSSGWWWW